MIPLRVIFAFVVTILAVGCASLETPRYSLSTEVDDAIRALGPTNVAVGAFQGPLQINNNMCRLIGPIKPPDNLSFPEFIRKAFASQLLAAGIASDSSQKIVLTGDILNINFSSKRLIFGGAWEISVVINSSNGHVASVSERYEFDAGFLGGRHAET